MFLCKLAEIHSKVFFSFSFKSIFIYFTTLFIIFIIIVLFNFMLYLCIIFKWCICVLMVLVNQFWPKSDLWLYTWKYYYYYFYFFLCMCFLHLFVRFVSNYFCKTHLASFPYLLGLIFVGQFKMHTQRDYKQTKDRYICIHLCFISIHLVLTISAGCNTSPFMCFCCIITSPHTPKVQWGWKTP